MFYTFNNFSQVKKCFDAFSTVSFKQILIFRSLEILSPKFFPEIVFFFLTLPKRRPSGNTIYYSILRISDSPASAVNITSNFTTVTVHSQVSSVSVVVSWRYFMAYIIQF
jgi:hypothetical protein